VTGSVESVIGGLLRVADDDVVELCRVDFCAMDGFPGGDGCEFLGREIFELSAIARHGRARTGDDGDICSVGHDRNQTLGLHGRALEN
jgi:hypothetical protein